MILVSCLCSSFRELLAVIQTLTNEAVAFYFPDGIFLS